MGRNNHDWHTGWPDHQFVKTVTQNVAQPVSVKINTQLVPWTKVAPKGQAILVLKKCPK
jgi:hypothetical protein